MVTASEVTVFASGTFFLVGLLTGVWKYLAIRKSPVAQAPRYVSVAHSAALHYSFAALVFLQLLAWSPYTPSTNLIAVSLPLAFFAAAILTYIVHAAVRDTDNQFQPPYRVARYRIPPVVFHAFVWLLIGGEIGGFAVLFAGAARTLLVGSQ